MMLDKGTAYALLAAIMWTVPGTATKILLEQLTIPEIIFFRSLIGAIVLLPIIAILSRPAKSIDRKKLPHALILGLLAFAVIYLFAVSVQLTTIANAQLLNHMDAIFTFLLAHLLLSEYATKRLYMGLCLSIAGALIIFAGESAFIGTSSGIGIAAGFFAGAAFSVYTIYSRKVFKGTDLTVMAVAFAFCALIAAGAGGLAYSHVSMQGWMLLAVLGAFTSIPYALFTLSLKYCQPQKPALIGKLTAVSSPLLAFMVLGQVPTIFTIAGGALIMAAAVIAVLDRKKGI